MRYIEELDTIRDKVSLIQEELSNKLSEQMNKKMYVLSIISVIFLPLTFLTGLLGINVGGIPGAQNENAFLHFLCNNC
jgi:zinc transporter